jgi:hypothetical protein
MDDRFLEDGGGTSEEEEGEVLAVDFYFSAD